MTHQIVTKLNEKRFRPLFKYIKEKLRYVINIDSELVGFCVWYVYNMNIERMPELNNKTRLEFLLRNINKNFEKAVLEMIGKYHKFIEEGLRVPKG